MFVPVLLCCISFVLSHERIERFWQNRQEIEIISSSDYIDQEIEVSNDNVSDTLEFYVESDWGTDFTTIFVKIPLIETGQKIIWFFRDGNFAEYPKREISWTTGQYLTMSSTNCQISSNWSPYTTANNYYLKGGGSFGVSSDSPPHGHDLTGNSAQSGGRRGDIDIKSGAGSGCDHLHVHSVANKPVVTTSFIPQFFEVVLCNTSVLEYPENSLFMFKYRTSEMFVNYFGDSSGTNSRIPRAANSFGNPGGSNTHSHTFSGTTGNCNLQIEYNFGDDHNACPLHTHSFSGSTSPGTAIPPYRVAIFGLKNSVEMQQKTDISDILLLSTAIPPMGFTRADEYDNLFLRGSTAMTWDDSDASSTNHRHGFSFIPTGQSAGDRGYNGGGNNQAFGHSHAASGTLYTTYSAPTPRSFSVLVLKRKTRPTGIVLVQTSTPMYVPWNVSTFVDDTDAPVVDTNAPIADTDAPIADTNAPPVADTEVNIADTISEVGIAWYYFAIGGSGVFILLLVLCVIIVAIIVCICCIKQKAGRKYDVVGFQTPLELDEQLDRDAISKLKINKDLFQINYSDIKLIQQIGTGGSGASVYEAEWTGKRVAVQSEYFDEPGGRELCFRRLREGNLFVFIFASSKCSSNGCCLSPPRVGIITEFCKKGTLEGYVKQMIKGGFPALKFPEKVKILHGICSGMCYLHSKNVIHRDLKSENVLLDELIVPKIMDFGLSKILERRDKMTRMIGTSYYIAPEIILSDKYDFAVDVFSFAMMMYEIAFENFAPFGPNVLRVELKIANSPEFRPSLENARRFPRWYVETMKKSWSHDPQTRPTFKIIMKTLGDHLK